MAVRRKRMGRGAVGDFLKEQGVKLIKRALPMAHGLIKQHKLVSRGIRMIPHRLAGPVANFVESQGYGKRRRRRRIGRGGIGLSLPGLGGFNIGW